MVISALRITARKNVTVTLQHNQNGRHTSPYISTHILTRQFRVTMTRFIRDSKNQVVFTRMNKSRFQSLLWFFMQFNHVDFYDGLQRVHFRCVNTFIFLSQFFLIKHSSVIYVLLTKMSSIENVVFNKKTSIKNVLLIKKDQHSNVLFIKRDQHYKRFVN